MGTTKTNGSRRIVPPQGGSGTARASAIEGFLPPAADRNDPMSLNIEKLEALRDIVHNANSSRMDWLKNLLTRRRDIDKECDYPARPVDAWYLQRLFDEFSLAARVVEVLPKESWQSTPMVYEDDDPENVTQFEKAWDSIGKQLRGEQSFYEDEGGNPVYEYLLRADILSGIGRYGIILLGIDDGADDLSKPATGVEEKNSKPKKVKPARPKNKDGAPTEPVSNEAPADDPDAGKFPGVYRLTVNREAQRRYNAMMTGNFAPPPGKGKPSAVPAKPGVPLSPQKKPQAVGAPTEPTDAPRGESEQGTQKEEPPDWDGTKLLYLRTFPESLAQVTQVENNFTSPRFGQPIMYHVTFNDPANAYPVGGAYGLGPDSGSSLSGQNMATMNVHWTRVIHVADVGHTAVSSEVMAKSRMDPVLTHLLDARKVYAGDAEGFWQACIPILFLKAQQGFENNVNQTELRDMVESIINGTQRWGDVSGIDPMLLAPTPPDPTPHLDKIIEAICVKINVPVPVFKGYEIGEQASTNNDADWNDELRARQENYQTPRMLIPLIDRLILLGVLPEPVEGYHVEWPALDTLSAKDKADVALVKTQALVAYAGPGAASTVVPPLSWLTAFTDFMEDEEAATMLDAAEQHAADQQQKDMDAQAAMIDAGLAPDPTAPPPVEPIKMKPGETLVQHPNAPPKPPVTNDAVWVDLDAAEYLHDDWVDTDGDDPTANVGMAKLSGGRWTTIRGAHVYIKGGNVVAGPSALKAKLSGKKVKPKGKAPPAKPAAPVKTAKPAKAKSPDDDFGLADDHEPSHPPKASRPPAPAAHKPAATTPVAYPAGYEPPWGKAAEHNPHVGDGARPALTKTEAKAVEDYTHEGFGPLNSALRAGKPLTGEHAEMAKHLDAALSRARPLPKPVTAVREMSRLTNEQAAAFAASCADAMKSGKPMGLGGGYLSTSVGPQKARLGGKVMLSIAATHGIDAEPYSTHPPGSESEFILPRDSKFRVKDVKHDGKAWHVTMEQVVPARKPPVGNADPSQPRGDDGRWVYAGTSGVLTEYHAATGRGKAALEAALYNSGVDDPADGGAGKTRLDRRELAGNLTAVRLQLHRMSATPDEIAPVERALARVGAVKIGGDAGEVHPFSGLVHDPGAHSILRGTPVRVVHSGWTLPESDGGFYRLSPAKVIPTDVTGNAADDGDAFTDNMKDRAGREHKGKGPGGGQFGSGGGGGSSAASVPPTAKAGASSVVTPTAKAPSPAAPKSGSSAPNVSPAATPSKLTPVSGVQGKPAAGNETTATADGKIYTPVPTEKAKALHGQVVKTEPLGGGVNNTKVVTMDNGKQGVWKPASGEKANMRIDQVPDGTAYRRETAAHEIAEHLGLGHLVPPTTSRVIDGKEGSVQERLPSSRIAQLVKNPMNGKDTLHEAAAFDYLIANTDRHYGNWMLETEPGRADAKSFSGKVKDKVLGMPEGKGIKLIDNGYSFPTKEMGRNDLRHGALIRAASHEKVPKKFADLKDKWPAVEKSLKDNGIEPEAVAATKKRFDNLVRAAEIGGAFGDLPYGTKTVNDHIR